MKIQIQIPNINTLVAIVTVPVYILRNYFCVLIDNFSLFQIFSLYLFDFLRRCGHQLQVKETKI